MRFLPVIERELRSESRHGMNYWMRVLSALVMFITLVLAITELRGNLNARGGDLFGVLQPTLFSLIWILGAILTCDCISKERRDGTLGLLFLTPLRPVDVALSKAASGILKTATVILATLPILAIPALMGGVSGLDLVRATLMDLMALFGSVSAGLIASARAREFSRAVVLSLFLSACFMTLLGGVIMVYAVSNVPAQNLFGDLELSEWLLILMLGPWVVSSGVENIWQQAPFATSKEILGVAVVQVLGAVFIGLLTLYFLNTKLRQLSVETGLTKRQLWWWRLFFTPKIFKGTLSRTNRAMLERNPIGWVHRRTLSARLAMWGWLGFTTLVLSTALVSGIHWRDMLNMFTMVMLALGPAIAFSAADSFRRERETGAFELLLVTTITPSRLLLGRLHGIWGQYALVLVIISLLWFYSIDQIAFNRGMSSATMASWVIFIVGYICVPIIGLDQSLHRRNFFTALIMTLLIGLVIPLGSPMLMLRLGQLATGMLGLPFIGYPIVPAATFGLTCYLFFKLARRAWNRAHLNLTERSFLESHSN